MKKYMIDLNVDVCVSCGACAIACMDQNNIDITAEKPFRTVFDVESQKNKKVSYGHLSISCMHCPDAPCVTACPCGCIKKDLETNLTIYDTTNCIGCHSCAMACPFGIPTFGTNGKMHKCDGCYVRVHNGMLPACVKICPVGALKLVERDDTETIPEKSSLQHSAYGVLKEQV